MGADSRALQLDRTCREQAPEDSCRMFSCLCHGLMNDDPLWSSWPVPWRNGHIMVLLSAIIGRRPQLLPAQNHGAFSDGVWDGIGIES